MLQNLPAALATSVLERLTLLANHVVSSEPVAMERLRKHSGATLRVRVNSWPSLLPALPEAVFRVTPAGLLETVDPADQPVVADLQVEVEGSNPLNTLGGLLTGSRPRVDVAGSAALAADVNWLIDNLRWDLQDDLAKLIGPAAAHGVGRVAGAVTAGLRAAVRTAGDLAARGSSRTAGAPPAR